MYQKTYIAPTISSSTGAKKIRREARKSWLTILISNNASLKKKREAEPLASDEPRDSDKKPLDPGEIQLKELLGCFAFPKIVITTRSELLARSDGRAYRKWFFPIEAQNQARDDDEEGEMRFEELRFAPFGNKLDDYIYNLVALEVRDSFMAQVGALEPLPAEALMKGEALRKTEEKLKIPAIALAVISSLVAPGLSFSSDGKELLSGDSNRRLEDITNELRHTKPHIFEGRAGAEETKVDRVRALVELLNHARKTLPTGVAVDSSPDENAKRFIQRTNNDETAWLYLEYKEAFNAIPELKEFTATPFMVEIVMRILRQMRDLRGSDASMKAEMALSLDEGGTEKAWAIFTTWRREQDEKDAAKKGEWFTQLQNGLEKGAKSETTEKAQTLISDLAKRIDEALPTNAKAGGVAAPTAEPSSVPTAAPSSVPTDAPPTAEPSHVEAKTVHVTAGREDFFADAGDEPTAHGASPTLDHLNSVLRRVLRRPPVRRHQIYKLFVRHYLAREAGKQTSRFAVDDVLREGEAYAAQLAMQMTEADVSKVRVLASSSLFGVKSTWDHYIHHDDPDKNQLLTAARNAAPVTFRNSVLGFIHKTVQEYLCAKGLQAGATL